MSFINLLIEKPRILFLTLSFILLAGISSAISIPIQENPELAQRWSGVRVFYPGASPERIETQIVNELEIKLREVEEIKELDSIISQGYASITVELEHSIHPDLIEQTWSMVQDKLAQFISPEGVEVVLDRSSGPPITVQYAISWNGSGEAPIVMMSRLGNQLKRKLSSIGATHATAIYGETDEEIVRELKEKFGENNWEVFYPTERIKQELSVSESYWTGLRKFDEQVAKDIKENNY